MGRTTSELVGYVDNKNKAMKTIDRLTENLTGRHKEFVNYSYKVIDNIWRGEK